MKLPRIFAYLLPSLLLLLPLAYNACTIARFTTTSGTVSSTGNPMTASGQILVAICGTISRCNSQITYSACESGVLSDPINSQIGAPTSYSNLSSVAQAEESGSFLASQSGLNTCTSAINTLSCSDPAVQGAYNPSSANPYSGAANIFPSNGACGGVLSLPANIRYVRVGAAGTGDGSDWNNACTGFSGACSASSLQRGYIYYVATGSYGSNGILFSAPANGTIPITIRAATSNDHGTESGWQSSFAATGSAPVIFPGVTQVTTDYWNFDGQSNGGAYPASGPYNLIFNNSSDGNNFAFGVGNCFGSTGASYVSVRYAEMKGTSNPSSSNKDNALQTCNASNFFYLGNSYLHDSGEDPVLNYVNSGGAWATNHTYEYNWLANNKQSSASGGAEAMDIISSNVIIRYNVFRDIKASAIVDDGAGAAPVMSNLDFYGNIIFWDDAFAHSSNANLDDGLIAFFGETFTGNLNIYNNTVAEINNFGGAALTNARPFMASSAPAGAVNILNNLFWNSIGIDTLSSAYNMDYNSYYGGSSDSSDTSAHIQVSAGNPFVNVAVFNFSLISPTAAGLPLPAPYNVDLSGKPRGFDGVWDRGALEY